MKPQLTAEQVPYLPEDWRPYALSALAQSEESLAGCNPHVIHLVTLCLLADIAKFSDALRESVKLQSHYAKLLNMYDGGQRLQFATAEDWIERLRVVREATP